MSIFFKACPHSIFAIAFVGDLRDYKTQMICEIIALNVPLCRNTPYQFATERQFMTERRARFFANPFALLETILMGLFFVQTTRLLIGLLYSRLSSAALVSAYPVGSIPSNTLGVVTPEVISNEIALLGAMLGLPLLMLLFGRFRVVMLLSVILASMGRILVVLPDAPLNQMLASQLVVGASLMFLATLILQRARQVPYFFVVGFGLDQVIRAFGNTFDPSMQTSYLNIQIGLSVAVFLFSVVANLGKAYPREIEASSGLETNKGILTFWNALGMGALFFLQLSLLALPNAITGRTDADYTLFVPLVLGATLLPLLPFVRLQARQLIAPFESSTRGWIWLIFIVLFIVVGTRVPRVVIGNSEIMVGAFLLTIAQLMCSLLWWWFVRPKAERERNFTGLWLVLSAIILAVFVGLDLLTYDYAFVRDFAPPLDFLNSTVTPLLRGFRGFGLGVILLAVFLSVLPMIQSTRRVPWLGGTRIESVLALVCIIAMSVAGSYFARPVAVLPVLNIPEIRVGTYNIHGGYSEFYDSDLPKIAQAIQESGAQVVLLQEVEAGRLTSFGVDQTLWLARALGMDRRYFATNEGLLGLAVLSRVPIVFDDGVLLPSQDQQSGLQRVQIQPDNDVIKLYNTSLGLLLVGDSVEAQEANQRAQLNFIITTIRAHIDSDYNGQLGRAILGGTFNNVPDSPLLQTLTQTGFVDPFAGAPREKSDTVIRIEGSARLDYLWIWSDTLTSTGYGVITENLSSDHRLAFVGIAIR
jgi:endonuclease/exonuclease/phosphatase family metal-dependent hydrolase